MMSERECILQGADVPQGLSPTASAPQDAELLLARSLKLWNANSSLGGGQSVKKQPRLKRFKTVNEKNYKTGSSTCDDDGFESSSIGALFLQIHEINQESPSTFQFVRKSLEIFGNTLGALALLTLLLALPIGMITVGVKYLGSCPKEPNVPVYLLVGGFVGLLKLASLLWKHFRHRRYERLEEVDADTGDVIASKSSRFTQTVLSLFLFGWFVCGNYWVFHIWRPASSRLIDSPSEWCDQTVYTFAFVQIVTCYALMGIIALLVLVLVTCHGVTLLAANQ